MKTATALLALACLGFALFNGHANAQGIKVVAKPASPKTLHLQLFRSMDLSLDPLASSFIGDSARMHTLTYETLYHWVPGDKPTLAPLLAEDFPSISEDGLTWTIKLRKGVKFHRNPIFGEDRTRELNANDVIASIKRTASSPDASSYWLIDGEIKGLEGMAILKMGRVIEPDSCEGLKAIDDYTVQITLNRPFGSLLSILAHPGFSILPVEAMDKSKIDLVVRAVGTGPYRLQAVSQDEVYAFKTNKSYWGDASFYERIVFSCADMFDERITAVNRGKLDEIHYLNIERQSKYDGDTLELIRSAGTVVEGDKFGGMPYIGFNMSDPIWGAMDADGRALRKAVCMALSRDSFEDYGLFLFTQNNDPEGMYPVGMEGSDLGVEANYNEIDVEKAAKLLVGTKYEGGKNKDDGQAVVFTLAVRDLPDSLMGVEAARKALSKIGIAVTAEVVPSQMSPSEIFKTFEGASAIISMWFLDTPDAQNFLQLFSSRNIDLDTDKVNLTGYKSEAFDKALQELNLLPMIPGNEKARRKQIELMTAELAKDRPFIPMADFIDLKARNQKLEWPDLPPGAENDLRFLKEKAE